MLSVSPSFVHLSDDRGHNLWHNATTGGSIDKPMVEFSQSLDVELPAGSTTIELHMKVSEDASSGPGWAEFILTPADDIRRNDGDLLRLPASCYQTAPPDVLTPDSWDLMDRGSCLWAATVVELCYTDIAAAAAKVMAIAYPGDTVMSLAIDNRPGSGCVVLKSQRRVMVFIAGTTNAAQGGRQSQEMLAGPHEFGLIGTAPIWYEGSSLVADLMKRAGVDGSKPIVICGHSMGGAIAYILALRLSVHLRRRDLCTVLTFGSPRPGNRRTAEGIKDILRSRAIRNLGDPVPFLCTHTDEAGGLALLLPEPARRAMDLWIDPPYKWSLYPSGELQADGQLWPLLEDVSVAVIALGEGKPLPLIQAHSMSTYVARLGRVTR